MVNFIVRANLVRHLRDRRGNCSQINYVAFPPLPADDPPDRPSHGSLRCRRVHCRGTLVFCEDGQAAGSLKACVRVHPVQWIALEWSETTVAKGTSDHTPPLLSGNT